MFSAASVANLTPLRLSNGGYCIFRTAHIDLTKPTTKSGGKGNRLRNVTDHDIYGRSRTKDYGSIDTRLYGKGER